MNKEQFFRGVGQLDDRILERYHSIDARLARKSVRKKRALRVLAITACLVLMLSVLAPIAMFSLPAGRAILQGDSAALTEQLNRIEGFAPWQERTAEALEKALPSKIWERLQTTPIFDVLTQSQYPVYTFKGMEFGAYLQEPVCLIYEVSDSEGRLNTSPQIEVRTEKYQDDTAAPKFVMETENETYQLRYAYSQGMTLTHQAVHVYQMHGSQGTYVAYLDAQSGECIYWESPERAEVIPEGGVSEDSMIAKAYDMLKSRVRDPEAYTLVERIMNEDGTYICEYSRLFHSIYSPRPEKIEPMGMTPRTCDSLTVTFDCAGKIVCYDLGYLGALRNANPEIPMALFAAAFAYEESFDASGFSSTDWHIVITKDGRLAMAMAPSYRLDPDDYPATLKYLAYLTEADPTLEGYEMISDGKSAGQRVRLSQHVYTPKSNYQNVRNEFAFDRDGNKITEIAYYDGKEYYRINYTYDEYDRMIRAESVSQEAAMLNYSHTYEYDGDGLLVKQSVFDHTGEQTNEYLFEYDEQGREIRAADWTSVITRTYGENGSYVERTESLTSDWVSETEVIYDGDGNLMLERISSSGSESVKKYEYDRQGRHVRLETTVDGELVAYRTLEYRDGKLYRTINYDGSGKIEGIGTYEYNEYSECILSEYKDARGMLIQSMSYEYGALEQ